MSTQRGLVAPPFLMVAPSTIFDRQEKVGR
jgi:hypothetical protein